MSFFHMMALLGLMQGVLVAGFILFEKNRNPLNSRIAIFLLVLSIIGFDSLLSDYYESLPVLWYHLFDILGDDVPWVMVFYIPLFSFFVGATDFKIKIPQTVLYFPFILFVILNLAIDLDVDFGLVSIPIMTENRELIYAMEDYLALGLFIPLHTLSFFMIKKSSNGWLKRLWWFCTILIIFWVVTLVLKSYLARTEYVVLVTLMWVVVGAFVYWLLYTGLMRMNLMNDFAALASDGSTSMGERADGYYKQLEMLIKEEKLFSNPDLGRDDVALKLGISAGYLTKIIKAHSNLSFTSYVNAHRIKEVQQMLSEGAFAHMDTTSIGLEAGFKSKSAFFTTFKKMTGQTPQQFKESSSDFE